MRRRLVLILTALGLAMAFSAPPASAGQPLLLVKTDAPDPVLAGGTLTYTLTANNLTGGPITATVTDPLPANVSLASANPTAGVVVVGPPLVWSVILPPNSSHSLAIVVQVDASTTDGTVITNTATLTDGENQSIVSTSTTVNAPPASVAASLQDAAMATVPVGSPLAFLGFAALLLGSLGVLAFASVTRR